LARAPRAELRDQDRVGPGGAVDRDADHLDRGDAQLGQRAQQVVLAPGEPFPELLERVEHAVVDDEADHVPG
jgi:hypothetical protein